MRAEHASSITHTITCMKCTIFPYHRCCSDLLLPFCFSLTYMDPPCYGASLYLSLPLQMFVILHNFDSNMAPPHSGLCSFLRGSRTCITENTSFSDEANIFATSDRFLSHEFDSVQDPMPKVVSAPKVGGWRMNHQ